LLAAFPYRTYRIDTEGGQSLITNEISSEGAAVHFCSLYLILYYHAPMSETDMGVNIGVKIWRRNGKQTICTGFAET